MSKILKDLDDIWDSQLGKLKPDWILLTSFKRLKSGGFVVSLKWHYYSRDSKEPLVGSTRSFGTTLDNAYISMASNLRDHFTEPDWL